MSTTLSSCLKAEKSAISHNDVAIAVVEAPIQPLQSTTSLKRASVPVADGSSTVFNQSRRRSSSESWAFLSSNIAPPITLSRTSSLSDDDDNDCDESSHSSTSTNASTPSPSSPISSLSTIPGSLKDVDYKDLPDQELLKSLAAFLNGSKSLYGDNDDDENKGQLSHSNNDSVLSKTTTKIQTHDIPETCDLVVHVRDFGYSKSNPYHYGNYPPEPVYEESEVEEEYEDEEQEVAGEEEESSEACGHARGLYDFDAENSTELSFKEGDYLWIHCRQFPGWFLGEIDGAQGLVPSNYVEML
ncbi:hypothetical protein BGZ46_007270 [Entomortierella lignicola]|nr:hypothetical protein BGZ46_007270 [Entomortierella lignicola]